MSDIKNLYNNLTNFYNVNDENFKEFMAEFYKLTNEAIKKNEIQGDLIKELQRMFKEFNENGIDENTVREKVEYFLENNTKIKNIIKKINLNKDDIKNINSELEDIETQKASKLSVKELETRINSFTSLPSGSTTGDAELIDGRTGVFGYNYANIGTSIREQVKTILKTKTFTKAITINDSFNGVLSCEVSFLKGQSVKLKIENNGIFNDNLIHFGYTDYDGNQVNDIAIALPNTFIEYTFGSDAKEIRAWINPSNKLKNGTINFICDYTNTLAEDIKNLYDNINKQNKLNKIVVGDKELFSKTNTYAIATGYNFTDSMEISLEPNTKYYLRVDTDCVNATSNVIVLAVTYESSGEQTNVAFFKQNELISFTTKNERAISLRIYISKDYVVKTGTLNITVNNYEGANLMERIDDISNKIKNTNSSFSIIGDSYSSYKKWIPAGYDYWYSDEGNSQTNNMSSVKQTWWWKLADETGLSLLTNCSYSGSTICNTGYGGADSTTTSFVTRVKKYIGEEQALGQKPNIIFVFGGTNDSWADSPIGSLKYSDWTEDDLKSFVPAFCYLIDYLKTWNPGARIINVVNNGIKSGIINSMAIACNHYGIENLVLTNIEKENGHPNVNGMDQIKNQIIKIL